MFIDLCPMLTWWNKRQRNYRKKSLNQLFLFVQEEETQQYLEWKLDWVMCVVKLYNSLQPYYIYTFAAGKTLSLNHFSFLTPGCHRHKCFSRHRKGREIKPVSEEDKTLNSLAATGYQSLLVNKLDVSLEIILVLEYKGVCVSVCTCLCANQLLHISNL